VPIPDDVRRFWATLDDLFATVRPTRWGAVVTDGRFPRIWDANYARIDRVVADLSAAEVLGALEPAARAAGAGVLHVVVFHPERSTRVLAELSGAGHRLTWDLAMVARDQPPAPEIAVEALGDTDELWDTLRASLALFGVDPGDAVAQLQAIERDVLLPGGKRWFGVRQDGDLVSIGALHLLAGVGYIDNVATFPSARGRGFASALTSTIVREARAAGAATVFLLADPDDEAVVRLYRRLGFGEAGRLASTKWAMPV
jgi:ribosomal protein S18 acetylase RimI-like enzyme